MSSSLRRMAASTQGKTSANESLSIDVASAEERSSASLVLASTCSVASLRASISPLDAHASNTSWQKGAWVGDMRVSRPLSASASSARESAESRTCDVARVGSVAEKPVHAASASRKESRTPAFWSFSSGASAPSPCIVSRKRCVTATGVAAVAPRARAMMERSSCWGVS